jgi:hypothetical protein
MKPMPIIHDHLVYELRRTAKRRGSYSVTKHFSPESGRARVSPQGAHFAPGPCDYKNAGDSCGPGMICTARGGDCVYAYG